MLELSQVMIVKNEEKNIKQALSWGKAICCEQIVVDTGSTDRTVELAEEMGARLEHFTWIDDFAAAKNYALSLCRGDWIAILDADESFPEAEVKRIPEILEKAEQAGRTAVAAQFVSVDDDGSILNCSTQVRFLKNHIGMQFRGRIHEEPSVNGKLEIWDATRELGIIHTGYSKSNFTGTKSDRNLRLILKTLEEEPDNEAMYGYLGDYYMGIGNEDMAEEAYQKGMALMPDTVLEVSQRKSMTLAKLIYLLSLYRNREEEMLTAYRFAAHILPHDPDFSLFVGRHYYALDQFEQAAPYLREAVDKLNLYGNMGQGENTAALITDTYEKLASAYYNVGDRQNAVKVSTEYLKADPEAFLLLKILLLCLCPNGSETTKEEAEPVAGFLNKLYDPGNEKHRRILISMAKTMKIAALAGFYHTV